MFNSTVTGPVIPLAANTGQSITQYGSNTLGALVSIGYTAKPYVGFEFNYGYARYTENYTGAGSVVCCTTNDFQIQTGADEITLGYVAHPPHPIFGLQPYPRRRRGLHRVQAHSTRRRRCQPNTPAPCTTTPSACRRTSRRTSACAWAFRQLFFLDPDYGLNYLTILKHANTYEPAAGFYLRY
jgi:hypothetical protein